MGGNHSSHQRIPEVINACSVEMELLNLPGISIRLYGGALVFEPPPFVLMRISGVCGVRISLYLNFSNRPCSLLY